MTPTLDTRPLFSVTITAPTIAELRQKLLDAVEAAGPVTSASAKNSAPTAKPEPEMWYPSVRAEPEFVEPEQVDPQFVDEPKPQVQDVLSEALDNDDPLAKAPPDAVAEAVAQMAQEEAKRPRGRPAKHANGNGNGKSSAQTASAKPVKLPKNLDKPTVLKVLERYLAAHGEASTLELLQTHGSGAQRLSAVDPADYPAVYTAILQGL